MSLFAYERTWDDDQIAKYGLFAHLRFTARMIHASRRHQLERELAIELTKLLQTKKLAASGTP